jgi:hypothetical protein
MLRFTNNNHKASEQSCQHGENKGAYHEGDDHGGCGLALSFFRSGEPSRCLCHLVVHRQRNFCVFESFTLKSFKHVLYCNVQRVTHAAEAILKSVGINKASSMSKVQPGERCGFDDIL